jgi:polysaccharide export outer membrane protein
MSITIRLLRSLAIGATLAAGLPLFALRAQGTGADLAIRAAAMRPQPGDRVSLRVFGEPSLSDVATVDELGRVTLPKVGTIQVTNVTIADLRDTVRAKLSSFLRDQPVEVGVARRVIVAGEVIRPSVYFAELTTSLGEIIAQAGGLKESAKSSEVYILRDGVRTLVPNWDSNQSVTAELHSGDQVIVGRKSWLALNIIPVVSVATSVVALVISLRR